MDDVLKLFHPVVREWFEKNIGEPSPPQRQGWPVISRGENVLISAPTGAGKTLSAFLECINNLFIQGIEGKLEPGVQVLYISPLKALNNDIYRNLEVPLRGIEKLCSEMGMEFPEITKAVRTGDTTQAERRKMLKKPPHILITTPESLFILLTSPKSMEILKGVRYVIVDEIHTLLGNKRGVHLALSIERLQGYVGRPIARIGLSATVKPIEEAARYLGGFERDGDKLRERPVAIVQPNVGKEVDLEITMPVKDFRTIEEGSIWPDIYRNIYKMVQEHKSTIVFVNNRAVAEKVAANLNAIGNKTVARTHHGCISKESRLEVEQKLKNGELPCLVATSSLELGIDIGAIDLMVQVNSPKSSARGLQRLGRAGHRLSAVSKGRIIPKTRGDLLECTVVSMDMMNKRIEEECVPRNCLDILAQHIVSMSAVREWNVEEIYKIICSSYTYNTLMLSELVGVLSMLSGDYEHDEDMPRSPMITWDRINNTVKGNSYSKMLALSGGTIPDKGYFGVYLENGKTKLGELDEVFVFEARLGDRFMLGTSAWKIKKIEKNRVIVTHSSSGGAKTPFWIGEGLGRPYESGLNFGGFLDEISKKVGTAEYLDWITQTAPMDEQGAKNLERYIMDQMEDLGCISNHKRIVVEYFSDDAGERRIVIHSHFGGRVNGALAMVMEEVLGRALHCQVQASNNDDGILINIMGYHEHPSNIFSLIKAEDIEDILINKIPTTPLFAMSFRYNASRALMMGVKKFGKRSPLWIQRLRAMELMQITEKYPDHPLIVETFRECMGMILDVPHLVEIIEKISSGEVEVVERITPHPSPFTNELLFNFMGVAMYEGLLPDPRKPDNKLLSGKKVLNLNIKLEKNLLDKNAILEVTGKNNFLGHKKHINSMDELHDIMLTYGEIALNDVNLEGLLKLGIEKPMDWLFELKSQGRATNIENSGGGLWIAAEEWGMYSSGLGLGDSPVEDNTWTKDEALYRILRRFARYNSPFSHIDLASRYPLDNETILKYISRLEQDGVLISGNFMDSGEDEYCHSVIYEKIRIHSMNLSRKSIKANNVNVLADFVPNIQGIGKELVSPIEGLYDAAVKLKGLFLPVEWWEEFIFPSRVKNYKKSYIDRLLSSGRLIWRIKSGEGTPRLAWFEPSDMDFNSSCDFSQNILTEEEKNVFTTLKSRGACFLHTLSAFTMMNNSRLMAALEGLVWKGIVTNDSFEPIRYFLSGKSANAKARSKKRAIAFKAEMGRWETAPSIKQISIEDYIVLLLKRYGIVSKEIFQYERSQNIWNDAYEILKQWEYTGRVSRGYYVEGMSGIQFMMPEEIQKLLVMSQEIRVINACDPSQVYGQIAPRNQEDEPWMCIPSNTLIIREGRPVMIAEAYGERISILSDDENTLKYLEAMVEAFNTARIWPDRNKIRLKEFNGTSPIQCPYAVELKSLGFENEMMEMILWRKQG